MHVSSRLWTAGSLGAALLAGVAFVSVKSIGGALPQPTGPFSVGVTTLTLARGSERGTYEVQVWYPGRSSDDRAPYGTGAPGLRGFVYQRVLRSHAARNVPLAESTQRFPVVVYVAGWGGQRTDNTILAEDLASHGFVVAAMSDVAYDRPPAEDLALPLDFASERAYETTLETARARIATEARRVSEVLDELQLRDERDPSGFFSHRLRLKNAAVIGFSLGGAVALSACARDPRFSAAVNFDGWLFGTRNARACPYLLMSDDEPLPSSADLASANLQHRYESILNASDDAMQRQALSHDGYVVRVRGATHFDFTDAPAYFASGWHPQAGIEPKRMTDIVNQYTLNFLNRYLMGKPAPLLAPGNLLDPAAKLDRVGGESSTPRASTA